MVPHPASHALPVQAVGAPGTPASVNSTLTTTASSSAGQLQTNMTASCTNSNSGVAGTASATTSVNSAESHAVLNWIWEAHLDGLGRYVSLVCYSFYLFLGGGEGGGSGGWGGRWEEWPGDADSVRGDSTLSCSTMHHPSPFYPAELRVQCAIRGPLWQCVEHDNKHLLLGTAPSLAATAAADRPTLHRPPNSVLECWHLVWCTLLSRAVRGRLNPKNGVQHYRNSAGAVLPSHPACSKRILPKHDPETMHILRQCSVFDLLLRHALCGPVCIFSHLLCTSMPCTPTML